jgi:hypothetical protein
MTIIVGCKAAIHPMLRHVMSARRSPHLKDSHLKHPTMTANHQKNLWNLCDVFHDANSTPRVISKFSARAPRHYRRPRLRLRQKMQRSLESILHLQTPASYMSAHNLRPSRTLRLPSQVVCKDLFSKHEAPRFIKSYFKFLRLRGPVRQDA